MFVHIAESLLRDYILWVAKKINDFPEFFQSIQIEENLF